MNFLIKVQSTDVEDTYRIIKFERFDQDTETADQALPHGVDSVPYAGLIGIYHETSVNDDTVITGYLNPDQKAAIGETRLYATDANGVLKGQIWLHATGTIELGGTGASGSLTKHAAQFEALQTAFNQLKSDFNALVTKYNTHTHVLALSSGTGTAAPTVTSGTPSSADISGAKLNNILTE